ncbi:hypothetical protein ACWELJ_25900 [Nocardia sp. NPDC004582]
MHSDDEIMTAIAKGIEAGEWKHFAADKPEAEPAADEADPIEVSEYAIYDGRTAYRVTDGTQTILVTPPPRIGSTAQFWQVWRSTSTATLCTAPNSAAGIERARAFLERQARAQRATASPE